MPVTLLSGAASIVAPELEEGRKDARFLETTDEGWKHRAPWAPSTAHP